MKQSGCREIPSWPNSQPNTPRRSTAAAVTTAPSANDTTCSVPISPLIHGGVTQVAPGSTHRRPHTDHLHSRRESFHVKHGSSPTTGTSLSEPWAGHGGHRRRGHSSPRVDPTSGMCSARERTMRTRCVEDLRPVTIPRGPLATQLLASATPVRGSTLCRAPSSPELAMATVAMWNSTAPKSNTCACSRLTDHPNFFPSPRSGFRTTESRDTQIDPSVDRYT